MPDSAPAALTQLRAWLAQVDIAQDQKLPPERELCGVLGVSRGELRKALAILEAEGALWRQVGKGTFIGLKPAEEIDSMTSVASRSSPADVMRTRLAVEPMLAAEAAIHATPAALLELEKCLTAARTATTWREYETADNAFHRAVAEAAGSELMLSLFDHLNAVRRTVLWARDRDPNGQPPRDHHSFVEHDRIISAISGRDPQQARTTMRAHLETVGRKLLKLSEAAE